MKGAGGTGAKYIFNLSIKKQVSRELGGSAPVLLQCSGQTWEDWGVGLKQPF